MALAIFFAALVMIVFAVIAVLLGYIFINDTSEESDE